MDTHTFASLAQVQILLHPVGATPQAAFEKYASEIRSIESIRLADIPADHKDEKASRFMPSPLSPGYLQIRFPTHPPPQAHAPLSLLRPSHFPLAVIGVASCVHSDSLSSISGQFDALVSDIFPQGSIFPLAKHLFVFEEGDTSSSSHLMESLPSVSVIPSLMGNKKLYIGTLLADLCSQVLKGFGTLAQALESPLGNEYLNSGLMPQLPPLSDLPSPLDGSESSRPNSAISLPSFSSQPEISKPFSLGAAPSTLKRNSTTTGSSYRQSSLMVPAAKKRLSTIGMSSPLGRLYKMFGDFCLLAGRTEDSIKWYTESIQVFKVSQDPIWHASALEGLATTAIIDSWSAGQGLHNSTATAREPWAHIGDKLAQATALYHKTPAPDSEQTHSLLVYLYCLCVLRHASLYFSVWSAKGWGPLAFTAMLHPGPKPYLPPTLAHDGGQDWVSLERLSHISTVSRSAIASILSAIHGPWLLHLGSRERISVLESTASIFSSLGYKRKEAYILREILGSLLDLIVCGRDEDGMSQPNNGLHTGGLGIHSITPAPGQTWGAVGVRLSESSQGNESVLFVLKCVCKILGINLEAVKLVEDSEGSRPVSISEGALISQYEQEETEVFQEPFGWPELQVGVVREAVAVAEALPDYPSVAQFALSALKTLRASLDPEDQYRLHSRSVDSLKIAVRRGDRRSIEYWSGRPVINIALAPLPTIRLPIEKPMSILHAKGNNVPLLLAGGTDPFLYNPRRAAASKSASLVVQNEPLEFLVSLQNPYIFDLELQHLSLSTSGVAFETQPMRYIVPASSTIDVVLTGKPTETGTLTIRGCFVQAPGGLKREFILPLHTDQEEERITKKKNALACEFGRYKYSGIESFPWHKTGRRESKQMAITSISSFKFLECKVVPEQPLLRIRRTTITHGALMLYDGERSTVRLTVENISPHPVDFLRLAFDDSTIGPAQQALAEGELSVFGTYETEYSLINAPVFSWNPDEAKVIAPNQNLTLTVDCFGKVGCTNGTVHISYSYTERSESEESGMFYVRQVSYPLAVTVYHMLECHAMDIMPFPSYVNNPDFHQQLKGGRRKDLALDENWGWCLFSIEVRNAYGLPFDVTFSRTEDGKSIGSSSTTIPPGSMSRIILPIRKIILSEDLINKPIPTLSDRQFVVDKSDLSATDRKVQQELFWYREELLKSIRGHWQETGGIRSGELSLRDQRMTMHMLETLRLEAAKVELALVSRESEEPISKVGGWYMPPPNEFVALRAQVQNLSGSPVVFTLDLQLDPVESIVYEGILSDIPLGRLEPDEVREFSLGVCFLSKGRFELSGQVRAFGVPHLEARVARTSLVASIVET
ncbi:TRAPP II complex [Ephemerocybe angulata]|uniref:TRAPP II complex n=1 Tax=Ephemerocybe angulata TaxID=980116 RepID=A0A8H6IIS7_9AGAR|nr:TRAPP II complex [Tulosesus angulatus]